MKIEKKFDISASESVIQSRIDCYFSQKKYLPGYTPLKIRKGELDKERYTLVFKRGSGWNSYISSNPEKWETKVTIGIRPKDSVTMEVLSKFDINDTNNNTPYTDEFWNGEIEELGLALSINNYIPRRILHFGQKIFVGSLKKLGYILAWFLVWIVLSITLGIIISDHIITDSDSSALLISFILSTFATSWLFTFLTSRVKRKPTSHVDF